MWNVSTKPQQNYQHLCQRKLRIKKKQKIYLIRSKEKISRNRFTRQLRKDEQKLKSVNTCKSNQLMKKHNYVNLTTKTRFKVQSLKKILQTQKEKQSAYWNTMDTNLNSKVTGSFYSKPTFNYQKHNQRLLMKAKSLDSKQQSFKMNCLQQMSLRSTICNNGTVE